MKSKLIYLLLLCAAHLCSAVEIEMAAMRKVTRQSAQTDEKYDVPSSITISGLAGTIAEVSFESIGLDPANTADLPFFTENTIVTGEFGRRLADIVATHTGKPINSIEILSTNDKFLYTTVMTDYEQSTIPGIRFIGVTNIIEIPLPTFQNSTLIVPNTYNHHWSELDTVPQTVAEMSFDGGAQIFSIAVTREDGTLQPYLIQKLTPGERMYQDELILVLKIFKVFAHHDEAVEQMELTDANLAEFAEKLQENSLRLVKTP